MICGKEGGQKLLIFNFQLIVLQGGLIEKTLSKILKHNRVNKHKTQIKKNRLSLG
jgi:hypothetical protein